MGYGEYLRELLRPLGVYDLSEESYSGSELRSAGAALDGCCQALEHAEREAILATAEEEGLTLREALFAHRPVNYGVQRRREAVQALLRVGGDDFTLSAINQAIRGCGILARAEETGQYGHIRVTFPDVAGVPEGFEQIREIILDLIPCHLEVEFYFRYITWAECEAQGFTWAMIHAAGHTWKSFELAV